MRCNISLPVSVSLTNLPTLNSVFIKTNKISDISNMNDTDTEDVDEDMNVNEDIDVDDQVEGDEEDDNKTEGKKLKTKREKKKGETDARKEQYNAAIAAFESGEFSSVNATAKSFGVNQSTLAKYIKSGSTFVGKGKKSIVFSEEEENQITNFVKKRVELGVGLDFSLLCLVIQELLTRLKKVNPERYSPPTWVNFYPDESFVRRFKTRNGLSLRRTMSLSAARDCLTVYDLDEWFKHITERFVRPPEFSGVFKDPQRIFNQDETALEFGSDHKTVLATKGHKGPLYNTGGSSRSHVTISLTVSANGEVAGVRYVYSGKRVSDQERELEENLPRDGVTGRWRFSKSEKGYVNREIFLDILKDLSDHLDRKNIERPVMLFIDGFSGHLGLAIAEFCVEFGIQLILLRENMTHVLQPNGVYIPFTLK